MYANCKEQLGLYCRLKRLRHQEAAQHHEQIVSVACTPRKMYAARCESKNVSVR
jgi:hypothetical protein